MGDERTEVTDYLISVDQKIPLVDKDYISGEG